MILTHNVPSGLWTMVRRKSKYPESECVDGNISMVWDDWKCDWPLVSRWAMKLWSDESGVQITPDIYTAVRIWCEEHKSTDLSGFGSGWRYYKGIFPWRTWGCLVPVEHRWTTTAYQSRFFRMRWDTWHASHICSWEICCNCVMSRQYGIKSLRIVSTPGWINALKN